MRILAVVLVVVAGIVTVAAAHQAGIGPFANTLPVSLQAPQGLGQSVGPVSNTLPSDSWIHFSAVHFTADPVIGHPNFQLQVELTRNGAKASNSPNATGPVSMNAPRVTVSHLISGSYEWWARFYNGQAISHWVPFSSGTAFRVDTTAPTTPIVSSPTNRDQSKVYRSGTVTLNWSSSDTESGLTGYKVTVHSSSYRHSQWITEPASTTLTGLPSGIYTVSVRAHDRAGNVSAPGIYHIRLDSTTPDICSTCYGFSRFSFNPHYSTMTFNYRLNEPAKVRISIYQASDNSLVRVVKQRATSSNEVLHYVWHGRDDHGNRVSPGMYDYVVQLTDAYGTSNSFTYSNLQVLDKVIVVSIAQQKLWAYQDGHVVLSTLVTTGNVNCCATPPGLFTILAAYHPFTFISPEPKTSMYYYPPSPVNYALLFDTRGYYIHDAPWRTIYGPGTNQVAGSPGSPETGTHGCVNVPLSAETFLYKWAPVGTPVKILG